MIDVLDTVKQAYDISTTQIDKIVIDKKEYRITNVEYYDDVYEEGNIFGTAIARCLEFEIDNTVNLEKKEFKYLTGVKVGNTIKWISLGNFIVQDVAPNDTTNITKITAMDYMLKTNIEYKSELDYKSGTVTLLRVLQEACFSSGLQLGTINFANKDFIVDSNQFTKGTLNRQVIQAVAQMSGTIAKIKSDNMLYLINPNQTTIVSKIFTLNNYEEAEIKRATHPINSVSLGMSDIKGENITLRDEQKIAQEGENSLVINDNPFAYTQQKRELLITALFNAVKGFEYKSYSLKCQGLPYLETMDKVQFKDKNGNIYDSYIFRFNYKSPNGLESTIEAPSIIKATVEYQNIPDALDVAKRTEIIVDKQNQKIETVVSNVNEQNEKISQVTQTVDEIRSQISEIADITISADGYGSVSLENINESEPARIVLRPNGEDIAYLYPRENLYPSEDLFLKNRKIRFATSNYLIDYELPGDLLYYDAENYDEFILDYEGQSCVINKKVEYNADGSKYLLSKPTTISYPYPKIPLEKGDYTVTVLGYPQAYMFVRLMVQNMYTDQFATKAEMNSSITQTKEEIGLDVNKKLTNYSTTLQMNSAINLKADSIISSVNKKFESYDTSEEVNSKIEQEAGSILSTVKGTYETKTNANNTKTALETKISQTQTSILSTVSSTYATKTQLNTAKSEIKQTTDAITSTVLKKVGKNEVISEINQSAETVGIKADRIELTANDILNLIAGNEINMTSKNITLVASNCKIGKDGSLTLYNNTNTVDGKGVFHQDGMIEDGYKYDLYILAGNFLSMKSNNSDTVSLYGGVIPHLNMKSASDPNKTINLGINGGSSRLVLSDGILATTVTNYGITTPTLTQTSIASKKENIKKLEIDATELIKNADIFLYNLKGEKAKSNKHIGLVIGKGYNCPNEVISEDGQGVEQYSMTSLAWKAIQELIEENKKLNQRLEKLEKEVDNNG